MVIYIVQPCKPSNQQVLDIYNLSIVFVDVVATFCEWGRLTEKRGAERKGGIFNVGGQPSS